MSKSDSVEKPGAGEPIGVWIRLTKGYVALVDREDEHLASMKITEAQVERAVKDMLEADGWRSFKTNPVSNKARGAGFGEIGMADMLFIRYKDCGGPADAEVLWVENKAPGKQLKPHQVAWHSREGRRGALIFVVDDVVRFRETYKTSGLMRRQILS
jgi:hypothetical protein